MEIGAIIRTARKSKGLTQAELGNICGVQKSAVAKWENGRVQNIKFCTLYKLVNYLEINPIELFNAE